MRFGFFGERRPLRRCMTLSGGVLLAQLLPLAATPFAARLYGAKEFAAPALLASALSVTGTAACARLEYAVVLSRDAGEAARRFALCKAVCAAFSVLLLPFCLLLARDGGRAWLSLLPAATLLNGWYAAASAYAISRGEERACAAANVLRAFCYSAAQLALFPLGGERALLLALPLSYAAGLLCLRTDEAVLPVSLRRLRKELRAEGVFPRWLLPGALAVQAAFAIPGFALSMRGGALLGCWWLVSRLVSVPLSVVAGPAGQILSHELAAADAGGRVRLFRSFSLALGALGLLTALAAAAFSPLLPPLLGPGWEEAPALLRLLLPLFAVRMAASPLSNAAVALGRCRAVFFWQLLLLGVSAACAALPAGAAAYLAVSQGALCLCYLGFWAFCSRAVQREVSA